MCLKWFQRVLPPWATFAGPYLRRRVKDRVRTLGGPAVWGSFPGPCRAPVRRKSGAAQGLHNSAGTPPAHCAVVPVILSYPILS